ncbi:MAG: hypothetical protein DME43_01335 [Verrucomicrobia bacterium]|nr:MAG: hypothetical protein DME43_01335 [Verrucomicrobiota bacterium]
MSISFFAKFIDDQSNTNRPEIEEQKPMKTDQYPDPAPVFPQIVVNAVSKLKNRLQEEYERTYPDLGDLVRIVLDEEEVKAWELAFPHLFLPDLVEEHISQLGLRPAEIRGDRVPPPGHFSTDQNHQLVPAYADC